MMEKCDVWIEAEQWPDGHFEPLNCNSDVIVTFENGARWVATFFTYQNISSLAKKNQSTGDCLDGKYFWATEMILVDQLTRERIEEVVSHLIKTREFESIFRSVET